MFFPCLFEGNYDSTLFCIVYVAAVRATPLLKPRQSLIHTPPYIAIMSLRVDPPCTSGGLAVFVHVPEGSARINHLSVVTFLYHANKRIRPGSTQA